MDNGTEFSGSADILTLKSDMRKELNITDQELMFLFVGQHIKEKNPELIIDALSLIREKPFKMFFIGSGYAEKELHEQVKSDTMPPPISFYSPHCMTMHLWSSEKLLQCKLRRYYYREQPLPKSSKTCKTDFYRGNLFQNLHKN